MKKHPRGLIRYLLILLAVFLAIRISLLLLSDTPYGDLEELYMGTIAHSTLNGLIMPLYEYMYHPHEGGHLLLGLVATPFFMLIGSSWFTLKLTALLYASASFAIWYFFLLRFFNKRTANIMGFLICFAPPGFIKLSLMAWGNFPQSSIFDIALLFAFCEFLSPRTEFFPEESPKHLGHTRAFSISLFGFIAGLAIFACYLSLIMIFVCLFVWLAFRKKLKNRIYLLVFTISFVIGLGPWLLVNVMSGFSGISSFLEIFTAMREASPGESTGLLHSAYAFALLLFFSPYWFNHSVSHIWACTYRIIFSTIAIISIGWLLWLSRFALREILRGFFAPALKLRRKAPNMTLAPLALFILFFPLILILSRFEKRSGESITYFCSYRFLVEYYPFVLCALSISLATLWEKRQRFAHTLCIAIIGFIAISCIHPTLSKILTGQRMIGLYYKGYSYYILGWRVAQKGKYWGNINTGLRLCNQISSPRDREDYISGFTEVRWWGAIESEESPEVIIEAEEDIPNEIENNIIHLDNKILSADEVYRPHFYKALGRVLCLRYLYEKPRMIRRYLALVGLTNKDYRAFCYQGMGQMAGSAEVCWKSESDWLWPHIPEEYQESFRLGLNEGRISPYIQVAKRSPLNSGKR